jgi:hypothetical protein
MPVSGTSLEAAAVRVWSLSHRHVIDIRVITFRDTILTASYSVSQVRKCKCRHRIKILPLTQRLVRTVDPRLRKVS